MVKNKKILKEIAKRFAKAALQDIAETAFEDTGLTHEEECYISEQLELIGERLTDLPICNTTDELVSEYYE